MLTEHQKDAYRYLLYWAMLDIRNKCQPRLKESYNPLTWRQRYRESRVAGAVADWLHNLALYSAGDFNGFDEERFWREFKGMSKRLTTVDFTHYRTTFERRLSELRDGA
jgi:hypothetical protein